MQGDATAHGALTVVNAIPTNQGAAVGLDLETHARVELEERAGPVTVTIEDAPDADPSLAQACIQAVADEHETRLSGSVHTTSQIPIARGLKSSSAAANAITLAALDALDAPATPETVLRLSVDAAREAGVTVTGALDDAAASLYGGLVVTDNVKDRVEHRERLNTDASVVCLVPPEARFTNTLHSDDFARAEPVAQRSLELAREGAWKQALTLNGLGIQAALGQGNDAIYRALQAGAQAAGVTGTGPAIGAVVPSQSEPLIRRAWEPYTLEGVSIIETRLRDAKEDPT